MSKIDNASLNEFARLLLARARSHDAVSAVESSSTLPKNLSIEALYEALTLQHEAMETLTARFTAETDILTAAMERMERDLAIAKGQVERLSSLQIAQNTDMQRVVAEVTDLAEACVDKLTDNFDQRLKSLSAAS